MTNAHIENIEGITIVIGRNAGAGWNVSRRFPNGPRTTYTGLSAAAAASLFDALCANAAEMGAQ